MIRLRQLHCPGPGDSGIVSTLENKLVVSRNASFARLLTIHDLFFCDAHLIIHQAVLLDTVAQTDQFSRQVLKDLGAHDRLRLAKSLTLNILLGEVALFLQGH